MPRVSRWASGLIWPGLPLLYLVLPGHPLGLLTGLPLTILSLTIGLVLAVLAWCGCRPAQRPFSWVAVVLALAIGLKLLAASLALPYGLTATYRAGDAGQPAERSTEWQLQGATRVDRQLDFVGDQFPVHFFNDLRRFNFYTSNQPRRDVLPFSASWRGWLVQEDGGERCLLLQATSTAAMRLANLPSAAVDRASHLESREVCGVLEKGANAIEIDYLRAEGLVPVLQVLERQRDGRIASLGAERLLRATAGDDTITRDRWLGRAAWALDVLFVGVCLGLVLAWLLSRAYVTHSPTHPLSRSPTRPRWERPLLALSLLAAFGEALAATRHFAGRTPLLSGGNDWLAYETYARDVVFSGLLMTSGKPLGQGETFYYQPLYIYFLAAVHSLLGESVYGLLLAQYVMVALAGALVYFLAKELFGQRTALAAFALFWVYRYLVFNQVAGLLLSENLVAIIIPPMLMLLARWQRTLRWADLAAAGALLGAAIITRSTPLLFLPPALFMIALAQVRKFGALRPAPGAAGIFLAVTLAISSLVGVRNFLVAGRPALLPESVSANLWEAHRPTRAVNLDRIDRNPIYNRLGLDRQTREVVEFIRQDPRGYVASLAPMGLYAIGITGPALGNSQVQYELVALTVLYAAGLLFVPAVRSGPAWFLHAFILTHFVQMMVFMSHQYGFRLPLPMYGPMAVVAARTLVAMVDAFRRIAGHVTKEVQVNPAWGRAAFGAVVLLAGLGTLRELTRQRDVEAEIFGLSGDAAPATRAVSATPESWLADSLFFSGRDERSLNVSYMPGLAFREMKWLDSKRASVWPPETKRAMQILPSGNPTSGGVECWDSRIRQELPTLPAVGDTVIRWIPDRSAACGPVPRKIASFGGLIELLHATQIPLMSAGEPEVRVAWRVLQRPTFRAQLVVESLDSNGQTVASMFVDPYPSRSWESDELIVVQVAAPGHSAGTPARRLGVGFTRGRPSDRLAIDDPLSLYNQTRMIIQD